MTGGNIRQINGTSGGVFVLEYMNARSLVTPLMSRRASNKATIAPDLASIFRICDSRSYWSAAGNPAAAAAKVAPGAIGAHRAVSADLAATERVSALLQPPDCSL
ncbi:hypothetical protein HPB50_014098 [Hyalomma asiaticum]|uniref:Uncharacterized protein n=1 Tax=Hyalomma asiaticum TaxID=266040 RepID=A0ACB7TKG6_HYAAI|nr:hypothetical protein HPB50_014098 [Hyalomma asiaticum]